MNARTIRIVAAIGLGVVYVGLLGYSVLGYSGERMPEEDAEAMRRHAPRVLHTGHGVHVYQRRNIRSSSQRGGGLRGGK